MASHVQADGMTDIETVMLTEAEELSMAQHCALRHLAAGKSIVATAQLIGMSRVTIHNWLRNDAQFAAAFNAWRTELRISTQARLAALCDRAVDAVDASLSNPDGKMAMKLLTGMGMIVPQKPGPEDPEEIVIQQDLDRRRRKLELKQAVTALEMNKTVAQMDDGTRSNAIQTTKDVRICNEV